MQAVVEDAPAVVAHLWTPGLAQELDEVLTRLAVEYEGTRFVRVATGAGGGAAAEHLRGWPQAPALAIAWGGALRAAAAAADLRCGRRRGCGGAAARREADTSDESSDFGSDCRGGDGDGGGVEEVAVRAWLQAHRALRGRMHACTPDECSEGNSEGSEGRGEVEDEWHVPCTLCGRAYPHEHKRAVRGGLQDGDCSE
jgi:hypothetical protein